MLKFWSVNDKFISYTVMI